jgi:hypothetical protein
MERQEKLPLLLTLINRKRVKDPIVSKGFWIAGRQPINGENISKIAQFCKFLSFDSENKHVERKPYSGGDVRVGSFPI